MSGVSVWVAFANAPENPPWGQRIAYLRNPDGHMVELAQNLKRRPKDEGQAIQD